MSPSRPLLLAILSTTTTLGLLTLGAAPLAAAAVAPDAGSSHPPASTAHAGYTPAPEAGTSAPNATSPSGCIQRADYPHKSTHVPGTVNGVVTTTCLVYVHKISESAQMWETRWWGWDRIGVRGSVSDIDAKAASTNASDKCRNNTVRVTGSGSVVDVDGRTYYATTESIHVKNPCHL